MDWDIPGIQRVCNIPSSVYTWDLAILRISQDAPNSHVVPIDSRQTYRDADSDNGNLVTMGQSEGPNLNRYLESQFVPEKNGYKYLLLGCVSFSKVLEVGPG